MQETIALGAVEIYKEVDGVMTANPANFPDGASPRRRRPAHHPRATFDELCAMSQYGADVIQAEAARMARRYDLAVVVRNFRKPEYPGTMIDAATAARRTYRMVTGVADMPSMVVFSVPESTERMNRRIAELLGQMRLNFYALPVRDGSWKFAVKKEKYRSVSETVDTLLRSRGLQPIFEEGQWAIVTLVGEGLREQSERGGPAREEIAGRRRHRSRRGNLRHVELFRAGA